MTIERAFLSSKFGYRIFALFVSCALLPICVLTALSYRQVSRHLSEQSHVRLERGSKVLGITLAQRLLFLERDLREVALYMRSDRDLAIAHAGDMTQGRFRSVIESKPDLAHSETAHLESGRALLTTIDAGGTAPQIVMKVLIDPSDRDRGVLSGHVNPDHLWGTVEDVMPEASEYCVFDKSGSLLFSSHAPSESFAREFDAAQAQSSGEFRWELNDESYLARFSAVPLKSDFASPSWVIVVSEPTVAVMQAARDFRRTFFLVALVSLWLVLLLSINQIRRGLLPLRKLKDAAIRFERREFDNRVEIKSGDEFEELADAFNAMARGLERQFQTLDTISEIDRSVAACLDVETIADAMIARMGEVVPCEGAAATLLDPEDGWSAETFVRLYEKEITNIMVRAAITNREREALLACGDHLVVRSDRHTPGFLSPLVQHGMNHFVLFPVFEQTALRGAISLGWSSKPAIGDDEIKWGRQLADKVAVATANARLIDELDQMIWGTLTALARAIDTKSPWTSGHSERVTMLALKIADVLKLSREEYSDLRKGGLLHDVGKIGVPQYILDKKSALTDEETRIMRGHVDIGLRILEPIDAFAGALQIVAEHHERWDGSGYPKGLSARDISLGARIFAVADCYDSLNSDRPYRPSLGRLETISYIRKNSGKLFDPAVVEAFLKVVARQGDLADTTTRGSQSSELLMTVPPQDHL